MSFYNCAGYRHDAFQNEQKRGCSTGASDSPAPPEIGYRDFGVTSSFVVEASGFDELPGPGCAFFSCVSSDAFCFWPCLSAQPLVRSSYHPSETRTGFRGGALVYSFHERTFRKLVRTIYSRNMTHMDAEQKRACKLKMLGIAIGIIIVIPILAWKWGLL
jgi:hypothetical protein